MSFRVFELASSFALVVAFSIALYRNLTSPGMNYSPSIAVALAGALFVFGLLVISVLSLQPSEAANAIANNAADDILTKQQSISNCTDDATRVLDELLRRDLVAVRSSEQAIASLVRVIATASPKTVVDEIIRLLDRDEDFDEIRATDSELRDFVNLTMRADFTSHAGSTRGRHDDTQSQWVRAPDGTWILVRPFKSQPPTADQLLVDLESNNPLTRTGAALNLLTKHPDTFDRVVHVLDQWSASSDPIDRFVAARLFGAIGGVFPQDYPHSPNDLPYYARGLAADRLISLLESIDARVRNLAAQTIGKMRASRAIPLLERLRVSDLSAEVRETCAEALTHLQ